MGLKTMRGFSWWLDSMLFRLRQNTLYSDIQDIEMGIKILKKGGIWRTIYRFESNLDYTLQEQIRLLEFLKKQNMEFIAFRGKQRNELIALNLQFQIENVDFGAEGPIPEGATHG